MALKRQLDVNESYDPENMSLGNHKNHDNKNTANVSCIQNMLSYFSQFCGATSMHGFQYLGERGRYILERFFWFIILTVVWYFCISLVLKSYYKWQNSPILVSFATTETPIWKIPFPAITICPETKYNPSVLNFTSIFMKKMQQLNVSEEEEDILQNLLFICNKFDQVSFLDNFRANNFSDDIEILGLLTAFDTVIQNSSTWNWKWQGKRIKADYVSYSLTEHGYCYSFNMLDVNEILRDAESYLSFCISDETKSFKWSLENGYDESINFDAYPHRTFTAGINGGASFYLYTNNNYIDPFCGDGLQGFKVVLHHPSELPNMDKYIQVPLDQAVNIAIKPRMINVMDDLREYSPQIRNCYYSDQRHLLYYKHYSQSNCFSECLSNYTLSKCGCIPFYLPKDSDTPTCGIGKQECVDKCKIHIGIKQIPSNSKNKCDCLPSCISVQYDLETSQSVWDWRDIFLGIFLKFGNSNVTVDINLEADHFSHLSVFYKEINFMTSERHELYGYVDFFANVGGLLGLFIGFSVTSAIEIVYFLTLRLLCNIKMYGKRLWSGDEELLKQEGKDE